MSAEKKIVQLGIQLPVAKLPAGNYQSVIRSGRLVYTSGRAPMALGGRAVQGKLGKEYSTADGYALARSACIDLLAALREDLGSLDRITRFLELHGAIACVPDFEEHAEVMDGASDLLAEIFGDAGLHVRSVIGVTSLRKGAPLTLRATLEVSDN